MGINGNSIKNVLATTLPTVRQNFLYMARQLKHEDMPESWQVYDKYIPCNRIHKIRIHIDTYFNDSDLEFRIYSAWQI